MKRKRLLRRLAAAAVCAAVLTSGFTTSSESYIYDSEGNAVYSPTIYNLQQVIYGADLPCGEFSGAADLFVDDNDYVYILDQGNQRVVILNESYGFVKELREFHYQEEILTLNGAKGLFYHLEQKLLYISDTENDRILVSDLNGQVERIVYKPESSLLDANLSFKPTKLIVDNLGIIFALSANVNTGAMIIFPDDTFGGFFGANSIKQTAEVIQEFFWRKIFSYSQYNASESYQATEFNNLFWSDTDRCIYTVSPSAGTASSELSKLNAVGSNLLTGTTFSEQDESLEKPPNLVDVTVDKDGLFSALDSTTGRIYQYDQDCNLLGVFGGIGYTSDTFQTPSAIECNSRKEIMVLDSQKNSITVFKQTAYGQVLQEALEMYNDGLYVESIDQWNEVLRENANLLSAHIGLGKAYMQLGDYREAMQYFKVGEAKDEYAVAKGRLLGEWVEDHFSLLALIVVVLFLFIYAYDFLRKQVKRIKTKIQRKGGGR